MEDASEEKGLNFSIFWSRVMHSIEKMLIGNLKPFKMRIKLFLIQIPS